MAQYPCIVCGKLTEQLLPNISREVARKAAICSETCNDIDNEREEAQDALDDWAEAQRVDRAERGGYSRDDDDGPNEVETVRLMA
jgi:hypothetical protein